MEQQILQKLHTELLRMLPGQDLAPFLFQDGLLTQAEYDQLPTKPTVNDKNLHILACLRRRPCGMLSGLMSCLEKQITVPGVKEILQQLKDASCIGQDERITDGAVGGASPIGSAVDPSNSEEYATADETEQPSDHDFSDFEDISPSNWSQPELPSEFKPRLQQSKVLTPQETVVLPEYGFPVKPHGIATKFVQGVQHGLQQIFDSSSADHGSCYFEFRKKKKTPTDHFSAFRVVLGYLEVLRQNHKIRASVDFSKFSLSLEKRAVSIAITGRNNAGKSTLINAMVGNQILPVHRRPETAVRVLLRHRHTCAMTGPELIESSGNEMCQTVARGDYILPYIRGRNEEVRSYQTKKDRQQQIMKDERLILHLNMPLLCSKSRVQLVDTPGFAAPNQPHLDDAAGRVLRDSAAYVLLISYHQLSNSGDLSIFDQLKLLDRAVSSDRRLIIAVTQHDITYTQSSEAEMSPHETIKFVSENFKGLGHDVAEDQIIPVSGKWALTARMLKKDPSNDTHLKAARRALADYQEFQACGQDYQSSNPPDVQQMDTEAIADALEEASNIGALESSIARVIEQCDSVVCKNAASKVHYWLKEGMKELGDDLLEKDAQYKTTRAKVAHVQECLRVIDAKKKELQDTITGKDSKVYQTLLQKYTHEAEKPCAKVKGLIPRHMTILKENCLEECRRATGQKKEPYSTCRLNDGINKFVKDILSPAVQDVVKDGCIEQTRQVCKAYVSTYVPDQFRVMKDAACDLPTRKKGNKTWKPPGATLDSVIGEIEESLILERFLKEHRLEAPEVIEWNWWDKFKAAIRIFLKIPDHGDPETVKEALLSSGPDMDKIPVSTDDIERMFDALTHFLLERTDQYFYGDDGIQKVVVEGFHAEYNKWVKLGLSYFENAFGETIRMQRDKVKKMTQQLKALGTEIDELNYFCQELEELRKEWFLVHVVS